MNIEYVLLTADDILLLCTSTEQVRRCIQIVKNWSRGNGMELNKNKPVIVVFANRKAHDLIYTALLIGFE